MDKWIKWISIAFVVYIIAVGNFDPRSFLGGDSKKTGISTKTDEATDQEKSGNFIERRLNNMIDPLIEPEFKEKIEHSGKKLNAAQTLSQQLIDKQLRNAGKTYGDMNQGRGVPAYCGQTVTIHYKSSTVDGTKIEDTYENDTPVTFSTAGGQIFPGLDRGIVGMKKGGKRLFFFSSDQAYEAEGFANDNAPSGAIVSIQAELMEISKSDFDIKTLKLFDKREGKEKIEVECTDIVGVHIVAYTVDNTVLYNSHGNKLPLFFKVGEGNVPFGLEQAVLDMKTGGKRTALVPPALMKTQKTKDFLTSEPFSGFPKDQMIIFDIELDRINKTYLLTEPNELEPNESEPSESKADKPDPSKP